MDPKITVLMSVHNGEKYLRQAIESILDQTFNNFEFLIINDGSADSSKEIIFSYNDPRINYVENETNIGLTKSLNKGLKLAKGEYVARMDADDVSLPQRLEKQLNFMENNHGIGVMGTWCYVIDAENNIIGSIRNHSNHPRIMGSLLSENQMVHSSIIYRKNVLEGAGGYDDNVSTAQDYELLLRLSEVTKLANYTEFLHKWRRDTPGGITRNRRSRQIEIRDKYRDEYLERNFNPKNCQFIDILLNNYILNPKDNILQKYFKRIRPSLSFWKKNYITIELILNTRYLKMQIKKILKTYNGMIKTILNFLIRRGLFKCIHPKSIIFLMKNVCNAKCIMCGLNYQENSNVCEITLDDYKKMIKNLDMKKAEDICYSGGGDPLLNSDLLPIIGYTDKKFPWIKKIIYTNGIALDEKKSEELTNYSLDLIVISINAASKDTYNRIMRVDAFDQTKENVKKFIQIKNKKQPTAKVQLSFVSSKLNINDLPDFVRMAKELGADEINVQYCRIYSKRFNLDKNELDTSFDKSQSLYFHQELSDRIMKESIKLAKQLNIIFRHEALFSEPMRKRCSCTWPMTTLMVGPNGEVYPCGGGEVMFYEAIRDKKLNFGNLLRGPVSKIWNCPDFKKIRQSCKGKNKDKKIAQCSNCNHTISWEGPDSEKSHVINF